MTQTERRLYLIRELLKEQPRYEGTEFQRMKKIKSACFVPCSIFGCRTLSVRIFGRYRTLTCRKKRSERE